MQMAVAESTPQSWYDYDWLRSFVSQNFSIRGFELSPLFKIKQGLLENCIRVYSVQIEKACMYSDYVLNRLLFAHIFANGLMYEV